MEKREDNKNPSIKILVGYHKPAKLLKDDILTPIHLGRALATEASKDGEMSQEDFEWMCENMIGDDTGDNISHLNRYLNELTGIYWAWKNYDKLGNPDYIGYMHYRRHFIFDEDYTKTLKLNGDGYSYLVDSFDEDYCNNISPNLHIDLILKNDIIVPKPFDCNQVLEKTFIAKCLKEFLVSWNGNNESAYNLLVFLLARMKCYEVYSDLAKKMFQSTVYYPCNMFVMKRKYFFTYCEFLFEIMFLLNDILGHDISKRNYWECRELAWISEYVTTLFFYKIDNRFECDISLVQMQILNIYCTPNVIRNHLSYKVGEAILDAKNFKQKICLLFTLLKIVRKHREELKKNAKANSNLERKRLFSEDLKDYEEFLKIKNSFSYKLGNLIVKHPFTFFLKIRNLKKTIN
ncbi:DUF4422 domain-containing protein [Campylobacter upsaliensis]|uniref:DUF4422 domain-containing protein n=1 Tax=Campylobacter upsaliensis TaxID=28080 RepID=UPI0022EB7D74|nr:DUF4422 domain-containing protein [Campylobacter upsaliensis]